MRYKDISIITKDVNSVDSLSKMLFKKYEIPVFIDKKSELTQNILVKYLLSIFEIFEKNWSLESVLNYVKSGFIEINQNDIYLLENYCIKYAISGNKWYKEPWQELEDIRLKIVQPLMELKNNIIIVNNKKTVKSMTIGLYEFLQKNNIHGILSEKIEKLLSIGEINIAKEYAMRIPCKVVLTDYRLAPKYPFPIPVEDCFETYKWVLDNTDMLGVAKDKIMIGGDSAGGNLATAVTLMAKDRHLPAPAALLLIYPVTDRRMMTESMKKYTDTPVWNAKLSKMMWDAYLGGQTPEHIEYASPIEVSSFESFPPTYIEVAEYDCLRDEGILLYERLKEENIKVDLYEVKNACHGFENVVGSSITKECINRRISWLKEFF